MEKECQKYCKENNINYFDIALEGGEYYELLFTMRKQEIAKLKKLSFKTTVLGEITHEKEGHLLVNISGETLKLEDKSYNHFSALP